jgi:hypothetical protein
MRRYQLAPRVYVCAAEEGAVFLIVDTDSYLGVDAAQARALSLVVDDWPVGAATPALSEAELDIEDALEFSQVLCDRGLIVPAGGAEQPPTPVFCSRSDRAGPLAPTAVSELIPWESMPWVHIRLGHVFRFMQSLLTAILLLRCRRFADVLMRAQRRRALHAGASIQVATACRLVAAFFHIRAFFYAPKARCLLDSVTLLEFLAHYDQHPQWVFGVQIAPFASHTWVQHETFILNGTPAYVRAYTPILVV